MQVAADPEHPNKNHGTPLAINMLIKFWRDSRDRLCGLVFRVSGYRYRGPGFDPRRYQIFWVVLGLERGPLSIVSLVSSIEELLEWKK